MGRPCGPQLSAGAEEGCGPCTDTHGANQSCGPDPEDGAPVFTMKDLAPLKHLSQESKGVFARISQRPSHPACPVILVFASGRLPPPVSVLGTHVALSLS